MTTSPFHDLKDKVCVITGGCGVFGGSFSMALLEAGAKVAIVDYRKGRCEECTRGVAQKSGAPVLCVLANVLEKESLAEAKRQINAEFGPIDILVNGAGGNDPTATTAEEFLTMENMGDLSRSFFGLDIAGFRKVFDLNVLGTVLPTMVFATDMTGRGGIVVNISSMNAFRPLTKIPAYSAAKSSVNNITEWLAVHLAKVNVRVNAIAPGFFLTKQNEFLLLDEKSGEPTPRARKIIGATPMGRFGQPEELTGTLLYLCSDMSRFVTGTVIPVDGGFNAYSGV